MDKRLERRLTLPERIEHFAFAVRHQFHPGAGEGPLSNASRPFMDQILKGSSGSI